MGRPGLDGGTSSTSSSFGVLTSSVSSSELLSLRRLPWCVGETDFFGGTMADSPSTERGLYFGSPDPTRELRLRTDVRALMDALGLALSDGEDRSSGGGASFLRADWRREWRVIVLWSGDSSGSFFFAGGLSFAAREGGARLMALERRAESFFFVAFSFSFSFESLCITSARAFPTEERPKDWRIELRVVGFERREAPLPDATSTDMAESMEAVYMWQTARMCSWGRRDARGRERGGRREHGRAADPTSLQATRFHRVKFKFNHARPRFRPACPSRARATSTRVLCPVPRPKHASSNVLCS